MASSDSHGSPGIGEIASGLATDIQDLVRGELALARVELDHKLHGLVTAAVAVVGGALVAFAGLVVLLEGGAALLAKWMPLWAALLIVGMVIVLVGGLITRAAIAKLSLRNLKPERTMASVRQDAHLVKEHI
jgi:uncharacterized membrane protein YqjE